MALFGKKYPDSKKNKRSGSGMKRVYAGPVRDDDRKQFEDVYAGPEMWEENPDTLKPEDVPAEPDAAEAPETIEEARPEFLCVYAGPEYFAARNAAAQEAAEAADPDNETGSADAADGADGKTDPASKQDDSSNFYDPRFLMVYGAPRLFNGQPDPSSPMMRQGAMQQDQSQLALQYSQGKVDPQTARFCPCCGALTKKEWRFCSECGAKLPEPAAETETEAETETAEIEPEARPDEQV